MEIYWTAGGRIYLEDQLQLVPKFGVITLEGNALIIYRKKSITGDNYKEEVLLELPLKEVKNIEISKIGVVEKALLFYLTEKGFSDFNTILESIGMLTEFINILENHTLMLFVNGNTEEELKKFEEHVRQKISHK